MEQRLSLVTLGVRDLNSARAFYESLGWEAYRESNEHICFFQTGCMVIGLYPLPDLLTDQGRPEAQPVAGGITLGINVVAREDVDQELATVLEKGATLLTPAADTPWGGRTAYFADPEGHPWEITWAPMFPLGANGALILP
ncbi:MAG: VOC family protein [Magnetococcales bacterium]|nr:VOC family protein [Magnetococcales bacterium]